jgi:hypothetical protein
VQFTAVNVCTMVCAWADCAAAVTSTPLVNVVANSARQKCLALTTAPSSRVAARVAQCPASVPVRFARH